MSELYATKYRKGTATLVEYPTLPSLTVQPRRVDIYQAQYSHDILMLEYSTDSTLYYDVIKTGVPVHFQWKQDTLVKDWIGYVSSISKTSSPQRSNAMKVMCVAGTFPLKERATRVFNDSTIPEAVEKIAVENGFNFIGDQSSRRFSQLTIPGMSYWEWIQEQAQRIGYGLIVDGMNFIFRPIDKLIDMGFSNAAVVSMGSAWVPFNTQFLDRTLDEFKSINGDNVESTTNYHAVKNVGGIDPTNSRVVLASMSPTDVGTNLRANSSDVLFAEYRTDQVVNDRASADSAAEGAAQLAKFGIPATAKCQGDPRIRPFAPIFVAGTGDVTDGFWIVKEAHHMFHKVGDYQMQLKVATDGIGDMEESSFRSRPDNAIGTVNLEDALKNNGTPPLFFEMDSVELVSTTPVVKQGQQGYVKTPTLWKAK